MSDDTEKIRAYFCGRYPGTRTIEDWAALSIHARKMEMDLIFMNIHGDLTITPKEVGALRFGVHHVPLIYTKKRNKLIKIAQDAKINPEKLYLLPPPQAIRRAYYRHF